MTRRKIATRAIAFLCCICACAAVAPAPVYAQPASAPLTAQARLPKVETMIDLIPALGRAWGERELTDLLVAFRIEGKPVAKRGELTTFLQNRALGVELTFRYAEVLDLPRANVPAGTLVLSNIRLYGPANRTHAAFTGELPFGLRFGDTREMLIEKFGPPDLDRPHKGHFAPMRWDTKAYALFANLDDDDRLRTFSLQGPVVKSERAGFEAR